MDSPYVIPSQPARPDVDMDRLTISKELIDRQHEPQLPKMAPNFSLRRLGAARRAAIHRLVSRSAEAKKNLGHR